MCHPHWHTNPTNLDGSVWFILNWSGPNTICGYHTPSGYLFAIRKANIHKDIIYYWISSSWIIPHVRPHAHNIFFSEGPIIKGKHLQKVPNTELLNVITKLSWHWVITWNIPGELCMHVNIGYRSLIEHPTKALDSPLDKTTWVMSKKLATTWRRFWIQPLNLTKVCLNLTKSTGHLVY